MKVSLKDVVNEKYIFLILYFFVACDCWRRRDTQILYVFWISNRNFTVLILIGWNLWQVLVLVFSYLLSHFAGHLQWSIPWAPPEFSDLPTVLVNIQAKCRIYGRLYFFVTIKLGPSGVEPVDVVMSTLSVWFTHLHQTFQKNHQLHNKDSDKKMRSVI